MSEETKQETQEIENTEETGAEDTFSATEDDNTATETQLETEDVLEPAETAAIEEAQETVVEEKLGNTEIEEEVKDEDSKIGSNSPVCRNIWPSLCRSGTGGIATSTGTDQRETSRPQQLLTEHHCC